MSGKNLVLELNAKMLSANQIAGFLNFNISKTIGGIKLIFCMQLHICYLQIYREQFCKRASENKDAINNNLAA